MPANAKVEPLTPARTLRGPFDYRLPAALAGVEVGSLLVVPFGRRRGPGGAGGHATARRLAERRLVALERRTQERRPRHVAVGSPAPVEAPPLTGAQAAALAPVEAAIAAGRNERLLLHGVTGSGKTEVYVRAAA